MRHGGARGRAVLLLLLLRAAATGAKSRAAKRAWYECQPHQLCAKPGPACEHELCLDAGRSACAFMPDLRDYDLLRKRMFGRVPQTGAYALDEAGMGRLLSADFAPTDPRVMLISGARSGGFWAVVLSVLHQALLARAMGLDFVVWRNGTLDGMCEAGGGTECWGAFFSPPRGRTDAARRVERALRARVPLAADSAAGLSCAVRVLQWDAHASKVYPTRAKVAAEERARRAVLVRELAQPQQDVRRFADRWWEQRVGARTAGGTLPVRVLGVHIRGTDKNARLGIVPPRCYYGLIDAYVAHHASPASNGSVLVFLATDDTHFEAQMRARYGGALLTQADALLRGRRDMPIWTAEARVSSKYRRSFEVMVDTLLLARCDFLLKSISAVSEFALYYRPELPSLDLQIPDQPLPAWAAQPRAADRARGGASGRASVAAREEPTRGCPRASRLSATAVGMDGARPRPGALVAARRRYI